jgi:protein-S-isoprenylcysteine O-methyltransferase Ste14
MSEDFSSWFPAPVATSLFAFIFFLWATSELFNRFGVRRGRLLAGTKRGDQGSYWLILLIVWGSMAVSILSRWSNLGVFHSNLQYLGLAMELLGIAFREWAVLSLGIYFNEVIATVPGQMLVIRGPYRWLRHPAYSGSILTLVGFPIALGTWAGALLVLMLCFAGFSYRVQVEERVLLDFFGDEYREYIEHTWRLFPGL